MIFVPHLLKGLQIPVWLYGRLNERLNYIHVCAPVFVYVFLSRLFDPKYTYIKISIVYDIKKYFLKFVVRVIITDQSNETAC